MDKIIKGFERALGNGDLLAKHLIDPADAALILREVKKVISIH